MEILLPSNVFHLDRLALVMIGLVGFLTLCIAVFATRYLHGDAASKRFRYLLAGLAASVMIMVSADHLLLLLASWASGNLFLVLLMVHKPAWRAARRLDAHHGRTVVGQRANGQGRAHARRAQPSLHRARPPVDPRRRRHAPLRLCCPPDNAYPQ